MNSNITDEQLEEMMNNGDESEIIKFIENGDEVENMKRFYEISRNERLKHFLEELTDDEECYYKIKDEEINLRPQLIHDNLISRLYKNHEGNYKIEDLLIEYHDCVFKEGVEIGMKYGKKFMVQDIQNNRFDKESIMNMTEEERIEYLDENREEI